MGLYTDYKLKILEGDSSLIEIFLNECISGNAKLAITVNGKTNETCKWYEHDEDLLDFSKKHPNAVFELYGDGEENALYKKYYKNGKMQLAPAIISFDEYDPSKLK